jgi:pectate lyase
MTVGGLQIKGISSVIIRNMKFYLAQEGYDLVALDTSTKVWIDHCEFYNAGMVDLSVLAYLFTLHLLLRP